MTNPSSFQAVDLLLAAMFCQRHPDRRPQGFMYHKPGQHPLIGGAGFEVNYDERLLLRTALFMRRNGAPHLRSLSVRDVEIALQDFIRTNFWIIDSEAWDGCLLGCGRAADAPFSHFISRSTKTKLAEAISSSDLFVEPRQLIVFPLVVVRVDQEFECQAFFLAKPKGLTLERLPPGYVEADLQVDSFPPFRRWDGIRNSPASWLGVWAATSEAARRNRVAILGALALLPHPLAGC